MFTSIIWVCALFWCKNREVTSGSLRQASESASQEDERWGVAKAELAFFQLLFTVTLKQVGQFLATNQVFIPKNLITSRVLVHIIKPCKCHSHATKPFLVHLLVKYFQLFEYIFAF